MSEFNLSEERQDRKQIKPIYNTRYTYPEEKVKEVIKLDWELFELYMDDHITMEELIIRRTKLIGEKLKGNKK